MNYSLWAPGHVLGCSDGPRCRACLSPTHSLRFAPDGRAVAVADAANWAQCVDRMSCRLAATANLLLLPATVALHCVLSPLPLPLATHVNRAKTGGVWKNTEDEILKAAVMKYGALHPFSHLALSPAANCVLTHNSVARMSVCACDHECRAGVRGVCTGRSSHFS